MNNERDPKTGMSEADRYRAFCNLLFNELGITKSEIRGWVNEAVKQQAHNLIHQTNFEYLVKQSVQSHLRSNVLQDIVRREAAGLLAKQLKVTVSIRDE